ncbi:MAG: hypothetical protein C5B58_11235 [Acidobacteria bacterium]|nr:MAG: hypothetical protein C5B58_11235 [Acidobacteriota bacterium]
MHKLCAKHQLFERTIQRLFSFDELEISGQPLRSTTLAGIGERSSLSAPVDKRATIANKDSRQPEAQDTKTSLIVARVFEHLLAKSALADGLNALFQFTEIIIACKARELRPEALQITEGKFVDDADKTIELKQHSSEVVQRIKCGDP